MAIKQDEIKVGVNPISAWVATAAFLICPVSLRLIRKKTYMISDFEHYNAI